MKNSMAGQTLSPIERGREERTIGHYLFVIFSFHPRAFFARGRRRRPPLVLGRSRTPRQRAVRMPSCVATNRHERRRVEEKEPARSSRSPLLSAWFLFCYFFFSFSSARSGFGEYVCLANFSTASSVSETRSLRDNNALFVS